MEALGITKHLNESVIRLQNFTKGWIEQSFKRLKNYKILKSTGDGVIIHLIRLFKSIMKLTILSVGKDIM